MIGSGIQFAAADFQATMKPMFFFLVCIFITVLLSTGHPPDQYGWMMLIGLSWLAGYLDCRRFAKSDREKGRVTLPEGHEPFHGQQQSSEA
jgi:hypothetical protein